MTIKLGTYSRYEDRKHGHFPIELIFIAFFAVQSKKANT
ncbi:hypothetical protein RKLH11_2916 [Rhodobacteraceae bacterium KLH11]|nr:hypothetical protein RKLH11_2916 [Rhodobacteraceae bacterium KLH11]